MSKTFPNIPITEDERKLHDLLANTLQNNPTIAIVFHERTTHLMPEMQTLLRKRNDCPEQISAADDGRIIEIDAQILQVLQDLLGANSTEN